MTTDHQIEVRFLARAPRRSSSTEEQQFPRLTGWRFESSLRLAEEDSCLTGAAKARLPPEEKVAGSIPAWGTRFVSAPQSAAYPVGVQAARDALDVEDLVRYQDGVRWDGREARHWIATPGTSVRLRFPSPVM